MEKKEEAGGFVLNHIPLGEEFREVTAAHRLGRLAFGFLMENQSTSFLLGPVVTILSCGSSFYWRL